MKSSRQLFTLSLFIFCFLDFSFAQCDIFNLVVEKLECGAENEFEVIIDFDKKNTGSQGFSVYANSELLGNYDYEERPITIGELRGDCDTNWKFLVQDKELGDCREDFDLGVICCQSNECGIRELVYEFSNCEQGIFDMWINFEYDDISPLGFDLYINDDKIGRFSYEDLPVKIESLSYIQLTDNHIIVCDARYDDCCEDANFDSPCDCSIHDFKARVVECDQANERYKIRLSAKYTAVSDSFELTLNDSIFGHYAYADLPFNIGPFEFDTIDIKLLMSDLEFDNCAEDLRLEAFNECPVCEIGTILGERTECNEEGEFFFEFNFEYINNESDYFIVQGNGKEYGKFLFGAEGYKIGPLEGDCETVYEFVIFDAEKDGCRSIFEFEEPICCHNSNDCHIYDLIAERHECNDDLLFYVDITFEYDGQVSDRFVIRGNGVVYDTFTYGEAFYTIGPLSGDCETIYEFIVIDVDIEGCAAETYFEEPVCCGDGDECRFYDIVVQTSDCLDHGNYHVWINFEYSNVTNDYFDLFINGEHHGFYLYEELPIKIENFPERDAMYQHIKICDNDNPDCCQEFEFLGPDCDHESECRIWDLWTERTECNDDHLFEVHLGFEYNDFVGDYFIVRGNGVVYDTFEYGKDFYTIGPLRGDCETIYEFVVIDQLNDDCRAVTYFEEPVCCGDGDECRFYDIVVQTSDCLDHGNYHVWINFEYSNVTNDYFDLFINGEHHGFYLYEELPIKIENFPERDAMYQHIKICDNDNPDCCQEFEFLGPDCDHESECRIWDLWTERTECNDDHLFEVHLGFEYNDFVGDYFIVRGNGVVYDTFEYGKDFYSIGPLRGDCETIYEFVVIDQLNDECRAVTYFEEPVCCGDGDECRFYDIVVQTSDCLDHGNYHVWINFEYSNVTNDYFDLFINGEHHGFYLYEELPIKIENFPERDAMYQHIKICDNDNPDCCQEFEFLGPDCDHESECRIWDLWTERTECNDDHLFEVHLGFEYNDFVGDYFIVRGNGVVYDTFEYGKDFYSIGPLRGDCETIYEFVVIDQLNDDCRAVTYFEEPICCDKDEEGECDIDIYFTGNYEIDGAYVWVEIDLFTQGTGNLGFDSYVNGDFTGFHLYEDLPVAIKVAKELFYGEIELKFCDNDSDCCGRFFVDFGDTVLCDIADIYYDIIECEAGMFYLIVDMNYLSNQSDSFYLLGNGMDHGSFAYKDLPVVIGPFPGDDTEYELLAVDKLVDICNNELAIGQVQCGPLATQEEEPAVLKILQTESQVIFEAVGSEIEIFGLYNSFGQKFKYDSSLSVSIYSLDKANFSPGIYVYNIVINGKKISGKIPIINTN